MRPFDPVSPSWIEFSRPLFPLLFANPHMVTSPDTNRKIHLRCDNLLLKKSQMCRSEQPPPPHDRFPPPCSRTDTFARRARQRSSLRESHFSNGFFFLRLSCLRRGAFFFLRDLVLGCGNPWPPRRAHFLFFFPPRGGPNKQVSHYPLPTVSCPLRRPDSLVQFSTPKRWHRLLSVSMHPLLRSHFPVRSPFREGLYRNFSHLNGFAVPLP